VSVTPTSEASSAATPKASTPAAPVDDFWARVGRLLSDDEAVFLQLAALGRGERIAANHAVFVEQATLAIPAIELCGRQAATAIDFGQDGASRRREVVIGELTTVTWLSVLHGVGTAAQALLLLDARGGGLEIDAAAVWRLDGKRGRSCGRGRRDRHAGRRMRAG